MNPAESLVEGVATYKTTLYFNNSDERIKSGMTADVTIKGDRRDNVFAVPQRAVITRGDSKFVQVLQGENVAEKQVKTGLRGSDGNIEITDGLSEGDQVIVFSEE
jgi:multidrug efflux pump subunit AcrA (membrane-fusion protein)